MNKLYNGYFLEVEYYLENGDMIVESYEEYDEEYDEEYENWVSEQIDKAIKEIAESNTDEDYEIEF